jgi:hypothetical protein
LKGYGLWVNLIQRAEHHLEARLRLQDVAVQVVTHFGKFEIRISHFRVQGLGLPPGGAFELWVSCIRPVQPPPESAT